MASLVVPHIVRTSSSSALSGGGRFDFDDGGTYCGGWADGKAHGYGVCTGPKGQGEFSGHWSGGFEVSGAYAWPSGSGYEGQWQEGRRQGLGVETRGRWVYRGEWTAGFKGRYGVRQSVTSCAKYDGTWAGGLQDGYGSETYADGGTFQGQWAKGMRHGYGVRSSAPFGLAAHTKPRAAGARRSPSTGGGAGGEGGQAPPRQHDRRPEDCRGGFVLKDDRAAKGGGANSLGRALVDAPKGYPLKVLITKPKRNQFDQQFENLSSVGSTESGRGSDEPGEEGSDATDGSFVSQDEAIEPNVIETYMGEWKNDKRCGFGIAERSDGIRYEGEWYNNRKFGYGLTTFKNGAAEQGKYKNNVLVSSGGKKHLFLLRSAKYRERIEAAVNAAHRASQIALQKADIAISRTATARGKAEQADVAAKHAREDSDIARMTARQFAPEFQQPGTELLKRKAAASPADLGHLRLQTASTSDHPLHQRSRSLYVGNNSSSRDALDRDFDEPARTPQPDLPPAQSALLDVFRNNPDRRPSAAGFLRRPSTANFRRPSTVVELKLVPSTFEQRNEVYPSQPQFLVSSSQEPYQQSYNSQDPYQQSYSSTQEPYQQSYQHQQYQYQQHGSHQRYASDLSPQQVVDDHLGYYYTTVSKPTRKNRPLLRPLVSRSPVPPLDISDLNAIYGLPDLANGPMEEEEETPVLNQRRCTMPTLDASSPSPNSLGAEVEGAFVRTGSLYGSPRRTEAARGAGSPAGARKNSLPDISKPGSPEPLLTREAIAVLSSQRREAIRRQEEEAERLKANPLLYLVNPNLWDWFSSQQLLILVVLINVGLAVLFFKVIL